MTETFQRALTLLDASGDTTISWDEDTDEKILPLIEAKMKEGFVFYILKPTKFLKINRRVKAKSIDDVREAGNVTIRDEALEKLFLAGQIGVAKTPNNDNMETVKRAANANEVVRSQSVGVRPHRGG